MVAVAARQTFLSDLLVTVFRALFNIQINLSSIVQKVQCHSRSIHSSALKDFVAVHLK